jgi:hypothetical protein
MTNRQAKAEFNRSIRKGVNQKDIPAIRQAWVNFIDGLQKSGRITERQAQTWDQIV